MQADLSQAATLHRRAMAISRAAAAALETVRPAPAHQREQHELAERLRAAAGELAPGWAGAPLDAQAAVTPLGGSAMPSFVRVGTAQPLDDARFPVLVPLLGHGHLTVDADGRDPRVAGLLRALLLRLLAAAPVGSLLVRVVDASTDGVFTPFAQLADTGLLAPVATDRTMLRAVLAEAEQWVRPARPSLSRHHRHDRTLLVLIAALPELTEGVDLARIAALARLGPDAGLHLVIAGWPPPPLTAETTAEPLARTTMITMRNPYALVGDPPGASFGVSVPHQPSTGLNAPVFLDPDPPASLVGRVCQELSARYAAGWPPTVQALLPAPHEDICVADGGAGLVATVGYDGRTPVTLRFNELTPHWLVCGRPGAGKTAFLTNVIYGLAAQYRPDDLSIYLLSFAEGNALVGLAPDERDPVCLPHLRLVGLETDREYALAVLAELQAELVRRSAVTGTDTVEPIDGTVTTDTDDSNDRTATTTATAASTTLDPDPAAYAGQTTTDTTDPTACGGIGSGRILLVLDEFQDLVAPDDAISAAATAALEELARGGRAHRMHLLLVGQPLPTPDMMPVPIPPPVLAATAGPGRTGLAALVGHVPVRVALPGGSQVLEPSNDAAVGLPMGTAVVNTAGGLGGPRGATRGHERVIRFPDPAVDRSALRHLANRIRANAGRDLPPARLFAGFAAHRIEDDSRYRALVDPPADPAGRTAPEQEPVALLGRALDPPSSTVAVRFDEAAGALPLAVVGPDPVGSAVLVAAVRSIAAQYPPGGVRFLLAAPPASAYLVEELTSALAGRAQVLPVDPERPSALIASLIASGGSGRPTASEQPSGSARSALPGQTGQTAPPGQTGQTAPPGRPVGPDPSGEDPGTATPGYLLLCDVAAGRDGWLSRPELTALLRAAVESRYRLLGWWREPGTLVSLLTCGSIAPTALVLAGLPGTALADLSPAGSAPTGQPVPTGVPVQPGRPPQAGQPAQTNGPGHADGPTRAGVPAQRVVPEVTGSAETVVPPAGEVRSSGPDGWQPRPDRARLYDQRSGTAVTFIPFRNPAGDR